MERITQAPDLARPLLRAVDKLAPVHHSLIDWNFEPGMGFAIGSQHFRSPPSALYRPLMNGLPQFGCFALKEAVSGNLLDGRITTYMLSENAFHWQPHIYFRAQTSPHLGMPLNTYAIFFALSQISIIRILNGAQSTLAFYTLPSPFAINTWYRFRVTWYTWLDASLNPALRIQFDQYILGVWTQLVQCDHSPPLWQTSPTNLIGFRISASSITTQFWIDDTEVFARFPG